MGPALAKTAPRWLTALRRERPCLVERRSRLLDEAAAAIADWVTGRSDPQLTIEEQAEVYIGYHATRARWREERLRDAARST